MSEQVSNSMIDITDDPYIWNRFFMVHPLLLIGSKEKNGDFNMAPKYMAMPLGIGPYFGFMATPRNMTYQNVKREKAFTVSFPRPDQLVFSSITASSREEDDEKPAVLTVPKTDAIKIDGKFLKGSYLQFECTLHEMTGKFGEWEMIVGNIVAAYVHKDALRKEGVDVDDASIISNNPLLAYLHPGRFSIIKINNKYPLPKDFKV